MRASKSGTLLKVVILPLLASLLWKRLQITSFMLPITTSTSDELFSRIKIDDFERPWTSKIRGFVDFCDLRLQCTLEEWTATKWLEIDWQFANRNCYRLLCILWALAQVSCQCQLKISGLQKFVRHNIIRATKWLTDWLTTLSHCLTCYSFVHGQ